MRSPGLSPSPPQSHPAISPAAKPKFEIRILPLLAVLALVTIAYANHFHNDFHFDDFHTVTGNPYVRELRNIPHFFVDADAFSTLPANRGWRPLVTASLAIDYWLGGGFNQVVFQTSTFLWFLLQLCLMFALFHHILNLARPDPYNPYIALFATALYGVHPAIAETVNYVIQRGDVYSTLGVIAGLLIFVRWPARRNTCLYLIPVALGLMSKPPALIFPFILFVYLLLFEEQSPVRALVRSLPALLLSIAFGAIASAMTPASYNAGGGSAWNYRITQPLVALRYFRNFFEPLYLSADTDHVAESSIFHSYVWLGMFFVLALIAAAIWCGRRRDLRPVAFGICWFILALIPTSIFPLAEVENDHRMFFPFVGLSLSVCYGAALLYAPRTRRQLALTGAACGVVLFASACGTWQRNIVWHTEESLWHDVALKSPRNGRGLMNYGLTQMAKGDYAGALDYFNRALEFTPQYYVLEINLGIANGGVHRDEEAERHFLQAIQLAPGSADALVFYSRWLNDHHRANQAIGFLNTAIASNPDYLDARYLLMSIYADMGDTPNLRRVARELLARFPNDATGQAWLAGKRR